MYNGRRRYGEASSVLFAISEYSVQVLLALFKDGLRFSLVWWTPKNSQAQSSMQDQSHADVIEDFHMLNSSHSFHGVHFGDSSTVWSVCFVCLPLQTCRVPSADNHAPQSDNLETNVRFRRIPKHGCRQKKPPSEGWSLTWSWGHNTWPLPFFTKHSYTAFVSCSPACLCPAVPRRKSRVRVYFNSTSQRRTLFGSRSTKHKQLDLSVAFPSSSREHMMLSQE